jgi:hypothetical protein
MEGPARGDFIARTRRWARPMVVDPGAIVRAQSREQFDYLE